MVEVPALMPLTMPVVPTVATGAVLLAQMPLGIMSDSVEVEPTHKLTAPVIGAIALTETTCVTAGHPETA